ncbi:SPOR domain-containing protein, partial [Bradyrhizobium sp. Pear76]|uniref:SPOR domain-containing protein n=1 Tax=Bradyrhizobium oropedii TaxID=1571201 RepID=UPI001E6279FE
LPPPPAKPEPQAKPEPAPLTSGVIQTQPIAAIPGSAEPMKPVKVKTVQVKAGQIKLAAAGPAQSAPPITNAIPSRGEIPETSNAMMVRAAETSRPEMPPQPANFGTGNGVLGVLPASAVHAPAQAVASIEPTTRSLQAAPQTSAVKPGAAHSGWIIQVGALESEGEANKRIDLARSSARGLLSKADPFTEVVAKDNRRLYRARFAGLERDQAEAACKTLKRAEISCITVRN